MKHTNLTAAFSGIKYSPCSTIIRWLSILVVLSSLVVGHNYAATATQQMQPLRIQQLGLSSSGPSSGQGLLISSQATSSSPSSGAKMASNREIEKQIVDRILGEGYDKRIRPAPRNNTLGKFPLVLLKLPSCDVRGFDHLAGSPSGPMDDRT